MPMDKPAGKAAILMFATAKGPKSGVTPPTEALLKKKSPTSELPMSDMAKEGCDCCDQCACEDTCKGCEGENCPECKGEVEGPDDKAEDASEGESSDMMDMGMGGNGKPEHMQIMSKLISLLESKMGKE